MESKQVISLFILIIMMDCLPEFHGPSECIIGSSASPADISDDGRIILLSFPSVKDAEVYINNGSSYDLYQILTQTMNIGDYSLSSSGNLITLANDTDVLIYEKQPTELYSLIQTLSIPSTIYEMKISKNDGNIFIGDQNGIIYIYQKNNIFEIHETITQLSTKIIMVFDISENMTSIAVATFDNETFIFENSTGTYQNNQTHYTTYRAYYIKITENFLLTSGWSNLVSIYKNNGSSYDVFQEISTSESMIFSMGVAGDFSKLTFGGTTQTIYIYTKG